MVKKTQTNTYITKHVVSLQKISCAREIKNKFSFQSLALSCIKVNDTSLTR